MYQPWLSIFLLVTIVCALDGLPCEDRQQAQCVFHVDVLYLGNREQFTLDQWTEECQAVADHANCLEALADDCSNRYPHAAIHSHMTLMLYGFMCDLTYEEYYRRVNCLGAHYTVDDFHRCMSGQHSTCSQIIDVLDCEEPIVESACGREISGWYRELHGYLMGISVHSVCGHLECAASPCENGAQCVQGANSYECICAAGWEGVHCETDILECASFPCENGAECVEGTNSYQCNCTSRWEGVHCEIESNAGGSRQISAGLMLAMLTIVANIYGF